MELFSKISLNRISIILLLLLFNKNGTAQTKNFKVFNAVMYKNTPDLSSKGLSKIYVIYDDSLLQKDINHPYEGKSRTINNNKIVRQAHKTLLDNNIPVCLDVESWPLDDDNLAASKQKYTDVLTQFKKINGKNKVGYYNLMPYADTYLYESNRVKLRQKEWMNKWSNVNENLKSIAFLEDISYPSFYTRTTDRDLWLNVVKTQVAKIRSIRKDIPVYGFIWPQYYNMHDSQINFKPIDADTWMFELEAMYKYCDGVVIWAPPFDEKRNSIYWNDNDPWWISTQQFIKKHNISN